MTFVKNEGWAVRLKREVGNGLELFLKTPLTYNFMNKPEEILERLTEQMQNIIKEAQEEIKKIRANRLDPEIFKGILVMSYGHPTPLPQLANITNVDQRTIEIKPWEKNLLPEIEKEIKKSNLGLTPINNGEIIKITAPQITEERREQLVKLTKEQIEKNKIKIKNIRQNMRKELENLKKEKISEDIIRTTEAKIQTITDNHIKQLDTILTEKEHSLRQI